MELTRREAFKQLAKGALPVAAVGCAVTGMPQSAEAKEPTGPPKEPLGLLYDTTKCVGCKTCVVACADANKLPRDTRTDELHQAPSDLNDQTKNIIKLYKSEDGKERSYVKQQCMQCLEPGCTSACMFGALTKDELTGVVSWNGTKCIGCRYCVISCPFHIVKFQWDGVNPKVVKCELCKERLAAGQKPACTTVCPTNAVIFGKREDLLKEAKSRIAANPGKYYENRVFGEKDGGGTQVLYLSHVPFENVGLPALGTESVPGKFLKWQKRAYSYMAVPVVLYAAMVAAIRGNFKHHEHELKKEQANTGLRPQL